MKENSMRSLALIKNFRKENPTVAWPEGAEYTIFLDDTVTIGSGTSLEPNIILRGNTHIGRYCLIRFGCEMTDTTTGKLCVLGKGQFTRCKIGNKVTAKHTCYLGDTTLEDGVNIADSVTIYNFDGNEKKETWIGKDSFIGGAKLVAKKPALHIGRNVYIAAGCVIRMDVADNMFVRPRFTRGEDILVMQNVFKKVGHKWIKK